jgi:hypothetical protein
MREFAKTLLHKAAGDRLYSKWASIRSRNAQVRQIRESRIYSCQQALIRRHGTTVLSGPFRGMRYTEKMLLDRLGGPRLLGSYECELHTVLDRVIWRDYECVLDIGSAEGYYAVGIARLFGGKVYAFDTEPRERAFCRELAVMNGVSDRVILRDWADAETLVAHCSRKRCFVMCDCEGYEIKLLSEIGIMALRYSDFLVECHEETVPGVSDYIQVSAAPTHAARKLHARPRSAAGFPESHFLGSDADLVLNERRGEDGVTWLWCQSRAWNQGRPSSLISTD